MTMKKELTLKHGVFIAAAVLLIAGIAFAGGAGAATYVDWNEANINSTGGDFIINDLGGIITGLYQNDTNPLILANDLTLDFNYQTVSLVDAGDYTSESGVLGMVGFVNSVPKLTIKNLIIDGGALEAHTKPSVGMKELWNSSIGGIIACVPNQIAKGGNIYLENISVRNVSLQGVLVYSTGGIIGNAFSVKSYLTNLSVKSCSFDCSSGHSGGFFGVLGTGFVFGKGLNGTVENCFIVGPSTVGGILGGMFCHINLNGTVVKNCVIKDKFDSGNVGGVIGYSNNIGGVAKSNIVVNTVITGGKCGGLIGCYRESSSDAVVTDIIYNMNIIDHCTLMGNNLAGGFIGGINSYMVPGKAITMTDNTVSNTCVVASSPTGIAAGFIAKDVHV